MLEPRVMLDGAAVVDGIETLTQSSPTLLSELGLTATRESSEQTNTPESDALYLAPTPSTQSIKLQRPTLNIGSYSHPGVVI